MDYEVCFLQGVEGFFAFFPPSNNSHTFYLRFLGTKQHGKHIKACIRTSKSLTNRRCAVDVPGMSVTNGISACRCFWTVKIKESLLQELERSSFKS